MAVGRLVRLNAGSQLAGDGTEGMAMAVTPIAAGTAAVA